MGDIERRNMERVKRWANLWNDDAIRMVDECYAENCEVSDMLRSRTFHGREELRLIEKQMLELDPTRRMTITRMVPSGDTVAVEVDASWNNGQAVAKSCIFLTFNDDGLITIDHSYGGDPTGAAEADPREA